MIDAWVRLWDQREPADVQALVRIGVALVIAWDLITAARLGLVTMLWAPIEDGGIGPATHARPVSELYAWLGASASSAFLLSAP